MDAGRNIKPLWHACAREHTNSSPRHICPVTGLRFYAIPGAKPNTSLLVPGATSILGAVAPPEEKERLEAWRLNEIAEGRDPKAGAKRGTRVHKILENYIQSGRIEINWDSDEEQKEALLFESGMDAHLRSYTDFLWSEAPLRKGWEHVWSKPDENGEILARVWSSQWGFAGVPDIIGRHRCGLTLLSDFKTSTMPYYRASGSKVPEFRKIGYLKYKKTVRQLCLYKLAVAETLGIQVDAFQIIVGLPQFNKAQMFFVRRNEIEAETVRAQNAIVEFWRKYKAGELNLVNS